MAYIKVFDKIKKLESLKDDSNYNKKEINSCDDFNNFVDALKLKKYDTIIFNNSLESLKFFDTVKECNTELPHYINTKNLGIKASNVFEMDDFNSNPKTRINENYITQRGVIQNENINIQKGVVRNKTYNTTIPENIHR